MRLCRLLSHSKRVQMLLPSIKKILSLWMSLSLSNNPTSRPPQLFFRGRVRLKMIFLTPLPVPTPMLEPEQQQVTNESTTELTDKPSAPLVEELRVYSRR
jgi:hypothetical protein